MPLLYLSVFGIGTFFGNVMSTSFVGDFSAAAAALGLPMSVRYVITVAGALALAAVHFWAGRTLVRWIPADIGQMIGTLGIVVVPVMLGTAAVILVNLPLQGRRSTLASPRRGFGSSLPLGRSWQDEIPGSSVEVLRHDGGTA